MVNTAIYYSAPDRASAASLAAYRATAETLRRTRDAIDSAISASFDGWHLDKRCLDDVLQACSAEAVAIVLAATLAARDHDGRFSMAGRTWAASVRMPAACDGDRACWFECRTHSAILDGFINLFRQRLAE